MHPPFSRVIFTIGAFTLVALAARRANAQTPITQIEVTHPLAAGFSIQAETSGGELKAWLAEGTALVLKRNVASTLPWSCSISSDEVSTYLQFSAGSSQQMNGTKTCCTFDCDNGDEHHFNTQIKDCSMLGRGCQVCTEECVEGYENCPIGTTEHLSYGYGEFGPN